MKIGTAMDSSEVRRQFQVPHKFDEKGEEVLTKEEKASLKAAARAKDVEAQKKAAKEIEEAKAQEEEIAKLNELAPPKDPDDEEEDEDQPEPEEEVD